VEKDKIQACVIQSILSVKKDLSRGDIQLESSFIEDLNFDSMGLVQLAGALEKNFNRSLPISEWVQANQETGLKVSSLITFLKVHNP